MHKQATPGQAAQRDDRNTRHSASVVWVALTCLAVLAALGLAWPRSVAAAVADLGITKTDGVATITPGGSVTYTITASNASAIGATGATVADTFPASLTATWTCVGAGGGTCTA